jgi:hypothetical protein
MSVPRRDPLDLLTLRQVSEITKRSIRSLRRDRDAGKLRVVHLGRSIRVPRSELERYIDEEQ